MKDDNQSEQFVFDGSWQKNEEKATTSKSIIICGVTRGGTSFAASVFGRLGVPYSRKADRTIGTRYEHRALRKAFFEKDANQIREIATGFGNEYPVWAWKLPAIQREFEFVSGLVPNPHFVIIFKEPLSVAARRWDLKGKDTFQALEEVLTAYRHMATIASKTDFPLMLISYDRAMANLKNFLPVAADFAGVRKFNVEKVIAGIHEDGKRYFRPAAGEKSTPADVAVKPAPAKANAGRAGKNVPFSYL